MPILDGSDNEDFYTEEDSFYDSKWPRYPAIKKEDYNFQDPDSRWQDSRDTFGGETDAYPTSWEIIAEGHAVEYRSLTPGMYQFKLHDRVVTVSQKGFIAYMKEPHNLDFEQWIKEYDVIVERRE